MSLLYSDIHCHAELTVINLNLIKHMKVIKFLVMALYFVCAIYAMTSLAGEYSSVGGLANILAALFGLGAIGTAYSLVSKSKSEYKPLPIGTDFLLLVVQVISLIWVGVEQFKSANLLFAVLLVICALFGGYLTYLWILNNRK